MTAYHCYRGMVYTKDRVSIASWTPLIMAGRGDEKPLAATRTVMGADVDYGKQRFVGAVGLANIGEKQDECSPYRN
jgi:hypothetical protein